MRIDLHTHSTASDGTVRPAQLVRDAVEVGLDVIGLTDHDTTAGWRPAIEALPAGLTLVPGAELSCFWTPSNSWPISLHLLAYLFDPTEPEFARERALVRASRLTRAEEMVGMLVADGAPITWPGVLAIADGAPVGRPHIAQALVAAGVVRDVPDAFRSEWLGARYHVPKRDIEVFDALRLVRGAGGVTVLAHPKASKRGRVIPDHVLAELTDAGLTGVEVDHPDHEESERVALAGLAAELGLLETGSSDFHGTNKTVRLGENLTRQSVYEELVSRASGASPVTSREQWPIAHR
ncbi:PHP domain-containing protein [Cryptosporangium phraense]|uniref:PHP domain-containing protein n=1 Tax=Cryptosporangium phraense TaxID=2593070 RepID=A0A545AZA9_9ACTN|nr:PHP domain-containing protein [Cryptosporangium phraense]TQS46660.1 PHP domain-containing protein [Cryptosporangium phraense]